MSGKGWGYVGGIRWGRWVVKGGKGGWYWVGVVGWYKVEVGGWYRVGCVW